MNAEFRRGPRKVYKMAFQMPARNQAIHAQRPVRYCESGGRHAAKRAELKLTPPRALREA